MPLSKSQLASITSALDERYDLLIREVRDALEESENQQYIELIDRAPADQFAIEFDWNILIAGYAQVPSLKIFDLGNPNVRTEHDILKIFDDLEITQPFEDDDVK